MNELLNSALVASLPNARRDRDSSALAPAHLPIVDKMTAVQREVFFTQLLSLRDTTQLQPSNHARGATTNTTLKSAEPSRSLMTHSGFWLSPQEEANWFAFGRAANLRSLKRRELMSLEQRLNPQAEEQRNANTGHPFITLQGDGPGSHRPAISLPEPGQHQFVSSNRLSLHHIDDGPGRCESSSLHGNQCVQLFGRRVWLIHRPESLYRCIQYRRQHRSHVRLCDVTQSPQWRVLGRSRRGFLSHCYRQLGAEQRDRTGGGAHRRPSLGQFLCVLSFHRDSSYGFPRYFRDPTKWRRSWKQY